MAIFLFVNAAYLFLLAFMLRNVTLTVVSYAFAFVNALIAFRVLFPNLNWGF